MLLIVVSTIWMPSIAVYASGGAADANGSSPLGALPSMDLLKEAEVMDELQ